MYIILLIYLYRWNIFYAGFSRLFADIASFLEIKRLGLMDDIDFFINLSGQVYPLKTNREIAKFLGKNRHRNFVSVLKNNGIDRIYQKIVSMEVEIYIYIDD